MRLILLALAFVLALAFALFQGLLAFAFAFLQRLLALAFALFQGLLAQHRLRVVPAPLSSPGPLRGVPVLHSLLSHTPCERGLVPAPVWIGVPRVPPILGSLFQGLSSQVPSPLLPCTRGGATAKASSLAVSAAHGLSQGLSGLPEAGLLQGQTGPVLQNYGCNEPISRPNKFPESSPI